MLNVLYEIERKLPALLGSDAGWNSLDVDYEPPRVERVYREVDGYRVYLHVIHPCDAGAALFHPHPWPSAMRVLSGVYEMGIGAGPGESPPAVVAHLVARAGLDYEMIDPDAWHWVRAVGGPALTWMVTGAPWKRWSPKSDRPLSALPPERVARILSMFATFYPRS